MSNKKRFWMSWWGGEGGDCRPLKTEGAPAWACSGEREGLPMFSICAVVDAEGEDAAWARVREFWPEAEQRSCEEKPAGWMPTGGRFDVIVKALQATAA